MNGLDVLSYRYWACCLEPGCSWSCWAGTYAEVQERGWLHGVCSNHDLVQLGGSEVVIDEGAVYSEEVESDVLSIEG